MKDFPTISRLADALRALRDKEAGELTVRLQVVPGRGWELLPAHGPGNWLSAKSSIHMN